MKSLLFILFVVVAIIATGCFSTSMFGTSYQYDYSLVSDDSTHRMAYADDKIDVGFSVGRSSISFAIQNKTDETMKIIWDEASIIQYGRAQKIMHSGIKYIDRNGPQPPTVIPPKSSVSDIAVPTENIYYRKGYYGTYSSSPGGWEELDLFPMYDKNDEQIKSTILSHKGDEFNLFLPIQYQNETLDYNFKFIINDVKPIIAVRR